MLMRHIVKRMKYKLDKKLQTQTAWSTGNKTYMRRELMTWKVEINNLPQMQSARKKANMKGSKRQETRMRVSCTIFHKRGLWEEALFSAVAKNFLELMKDSFQFHEA